MLKFHQDDDIFIVRHSSWVIPALLLLIPPVLIIELGPSLIDGTIDRSEAAGLALGFILPVAAFYFLFEQSEFRFSNDDGQFRWRWRNLLQREQGQVPLRRVVKVRRDALESSNSSGLQYTYRLVVILDDNTIIPLSRGFSGLHDRLLDRIVEELRAFLGHFQRMP